MCWTVLSLITGTFSNTLFPTDDQRWAEDAVLDGLQVPTVFLSPLCFTLKSMGLIGRCWRKRCDCWSISKTVISASTVAFVFRHFPALEGRPPPKSKLSAIKILYSKLLNSQKTETQRLFEEHCREIRKDLDSSSLHLLSGEISQLLFIFCYLNLVMNLYFRSSFAHTSSRWSCLDTWLWYSPSCRNCVPKVEWIHIHWRIKWSSNNGPFSYTQ